MPPTNQEQPTPEQATKPKYEDKQGKRRRNRKKRDYKQKAKGDSFKGATEEMDGHVFQVAGETGQDNQKQFNKTLEALADYASKYLDKHQADIKPLFTKMTEPVIIQPEDHASLDALTALEKRMWNKKVDQYMERKESLTNNKDTMFTVIWGQCSKAMQMKLLASQSYERVKDRSDCLELLKMIMGISYQFDSTYHPHDAVHEAKKKFYAIEQGNNETVREYAERYNGLIEMLDSYKINVAEDYCLLKEEAATFNLDLDQSDKWSKADHLTYEVCKLNSTNKAHAMGFLKGACKFRYGGLIKSLRNSYIQKEDKYPDDMVEAQNLLTHYQKPTDAKARNKEGPKERNLEDAVVSDVSFAQLNKSGKPVPGKDGKILPNVTCHGCGNTGHMKYNCPVPTKDTKDTATTNNAEPKDDVQLFQHDLRGSDGDGLVFTLIGESDDLYIDDEAVTSASPHQHERVFLFDLDAMESDIPDNPEAPEDEVSSTGSPPPLYDRSDDDSSASSSTGTPPPLVDWTDSDSDDDDDEDSGSENSEETLEIVYPPAPHPNPYVNEALSRQRQVMDRWNTAQISYRPDTRRFPTVDSSSVIAEERAEFNRRCHMHADMERSEFLTSLGQEEYDALMGVLDAYIVRTPSNDNETIGTRMGDFSVAASMDMRGGVEVRSGHTFALIDTPMGLTRNPALYGYSDAAMRGRPSHGRRDSFFSGTTSTADSTRSDSSSNISFDGNWLSEDQSDAHFDFSFFEVASSSRASTAKVNPAWILLDSESTVSIFCNGNLLRNIRKVDYVHRIYSNGRVTEVSLIGDIPNFGTVWYNPDSLANILSLAAVRKVCRVTMDSDQSPSFNVHRPSGDIMQFVESCRGLYFYDTTNSNSTNPSVDAYSFLNTVAKNEQQFTRREIEGAKRARTLCRRIGHPPYQKFLRILDSNEILNCPVTSADAKRAHHIYGPDIASLKGKTVRSPTTHVPTYTPVPLPTTISQFHSNVTICADIFKVQGVLFMHTISRGIQLRMVEETLSSSKAQILPKIKKIINLYHSRGFTVTAIHADNDFGSIKEEVRPAKLNICAANEHVGEIERSIRTMKDAIRSMVQSLPFRRYTKEMVRSLVKLTAMQLNSFVAKDGVSSELSPRMIVTGEPKMDYNNTCMIGFGDYVQTHEEPDPSNTMEERSTGAIALHPTGNIQGGYFFLSLTTWRVLNRRKWTVLPMPQAVIEGVHNKAKEEGQPEIKNGIFEFTWHSDNSTITDEPEAEDDQDDEASKSSDDDCDEENRVFNEESDIEQITNQIIEIMEEEQQEDADEDEDDHEDDGLDENSDDEDPDDEGEAQEPTEDERSALNAEERSTDIGDTLDTENERSAESEEIFSTQESEVTEQLIEQADIEEERTNRYNLRSRKERNYEHRYPGGDFSMMNVTEDDNADLANERVRMADVVFTQMSVKKGIAKHGQVAIDAMIEEYAQLDCLNVFKPLEAKSLSSEQKKRALGSVDLIKEKRSGKIKGRTCANGRPQRKYIPREDATSPTISLEALLITLIIDAKEGRDVATADVSGAFLRGTNEDFDILKITGQMVENVVAANPDRYKDFVAYENGKKVLYLQLVKAMYGLLKAAIIWWKLFSGRLSKMGFELNPYDKCVANKMINGSQCTIGWYVDDFKLSHADPNVVTSILKEIEKHFDDLTITRGRKHTYIGMDIELMNDGRVSITCIDYIKECIEAFGEEIGRAVKTPATKQLFDISEKSLKLAKDKQQRFHSITAKLLWVSRRARLDIQTAIAFLCTRVQAPTEDNWFKLRRVLQYLHGTIDMPRILSGRSMNVMNTYVDASYAVHPDMKSHTGGCISMGDGVLHSSSKKQSLNTKSSTEAEVVGASDYLPHKIWHKHFIEHQGKNVEEYNFFQDNQSAMRLERNGIDSARQKSRHINIRYFFIKDRTESSGINIRFCPTENMIGDFFTKPLQGKLFEKFRNVIMGLTTIEELNESYWSSLKERVGRQTEDQVGLGVSDQKNLDGSQKSNEVRELKNVKMDTNETNVADGNDVLKKKKVRFRSYADVVAGRTM